MELSCWKSGDIQQDGWSLKQKAYKCLILKKLCTVIFLMYATINIAEKYSV